MEIGKVYVDRDIPFNTASWVYRFNIGNDVVRSARCYKKKGTALKAGNRVRDNLTKGMK